LKISPAAFIALENIGVKNPYEFTEDQIVNWLKMNGGIEYETTLHAKREKYELVAFSAADRNMVFNKEEHDCVGDCMIYMLAFLIKDGFIYLPKHMMSSGNTKKT